MELRASAGTLTPHAIERYELANLAVAAPTKLTLAPLLATEIVERLKGCAPFDYDGKLAAGPDEISSPVRTTLERWRVLGPLRPRDQFLEEEQLQSCTR